MSYPFKVKILIQYALLLIVSSCLLLIVIYKTAGILSLYPNDWFLNEKVYQHDPKYIEKRTFHYRFISSIEKTSLFEVYLSNFSKILAFQKDIFRDHKHRTVVLIELEGEKYLLKRYNIKNFYNWIQKASIRSSLAYRSWHYGHELLKLGVPTPKPIALYEKKIGPFWTTCYVITEYLEGNSGLDYQLQEFSLEDNIEIIDEIKTHLKTLNKAHFIHSDYGLRNLLVLNKKIYIIDLDDLHHFQSRNLFFQNRFFKKHIARLKRDLESFSSLQPKPIFDEKTIDY